MELFFGLVVGVLLAAEWVCRILLRTSTYDPESLALFVVIVTKASLRRHK